MEIMKRVTLVLAMATACAVCRAEITVTDSIVGPIKLMNAVNNVVKNEKLVLKLPRPAYSGITAHLTDSAHKYTEFPVNCVNGKSPWNSNPSPLL